MIQFVLLHLLDSSIRYLVGYVHEADLADEVVPLIGFLLAHLLRRDVLNSDSTVSNFLSLPMVVDIHVAEFHSKASDLFSHYSRHSNTSIWTHLYPPPTPATTIWNLLGLLIRSY